ncbi:MAG: hypothetical protein H7647_06430 [Candidatus Heimdallarchaeota archaeon]|nr:hypothetical protein [Candidatus Heimdallarchaeota archaeon]MCK4254061.1 hypothetical protein [Candidatus Heimdallarchaeota archaeon]
MGHQDIMDDEFEQKDVWVVEDKELVKIFQDPAYFPVISALGEGPMTVKQITEKYNKIVRKKAIKMDIPKDAFEKMKRSEKTIYRYIKELSELGIVANSGQRLVLGKTATENLFSRVAKVFLMSTKESDWWGEDDGEIIIQRAARIIQAVEGIQEIDFDCFSKQLINLLNFGDKYLFNALDEKYDEVSKILTEGKLEEGKKLLSIISIASMLYLEESKKNLLKCYKK